MLTCSPTHLSSGNSPSTVASTMTVGRNRRTSQSSSGSSRAAERRLARVSRCSGARSKKLPSRTGRSMTSLAASPSAWNS